MMHEECNKGDAAAIVKTAMLNIVLEFDLYTLEK
jgi:hypothetical protein